MIVLPKVYPSIMDEPLNNQQRHFCRLIAEGRSPEAAYVTCHPKATEPEVTEEATRLLKDKRVIDYFHLQRAQLEADATLSPLAKRELLKLYAEDTSQPWAVRLKAIEIDNLMAGELLPESDPADPAPLQETVDEDSTTSGGGGPSHAAQPIRRRRFVQPGIDDPMRKSPIPVPH
jgi:hypothetical protein